ncbi:MAG: 2-amino-4-hydroxy-6-hydroxymethyldihydropteridine diphosphokinase [Pseudomonadales bacterium]|nr:2-amino-4-hydroxy-6-hydroxymethyldihydropteridine diphosphokinase [Pseudomonadales bacterium]
MIASALAARWSPAYIGVGSNLDDPVAQVLGAMAACARVPQSLVVSYSRLYVSRPFGPIEQGDFVNAALGMLTQLTPEALLRELRALESALGRSSSRERWGPRVIDLDLLVFGRERRAATDLILPHPGIAERDFVLFPLGEIAPQLDIVELGRVSDLLGRVTNRGIQIHCETAAVA